MRAVYYYSGMADIAAETGDRDYQSAVLSLWDNLVNRKYYVTGGIGSGETSEGFGQEYSLPNRAYCESCAGTGELLFQHKLNRAYHAARYADLYEETLYNAILGGVDLEGQNYTYTNPLDSGERRYVQHRLEECADRVREWVESGAAIYVCGSLQGMAPGVDAALKRILGAQAVEDLAASGRYCRDVY